MIRAILFDKDGTLTDFRATWERWLGGTLRELAAATGTDAADLGDAIGYDMAADRIRPGGMFVTAPGHHSSAALAPLVGWPVARMDEWLGGRIMTVPQVPVVPAGPLLADLAARGLRLGVLTNAEEAEAAHSLAALGATPYLDRVIGSDSGYGAKPDPRGARAFAEGFGLDPGEVAMVGDGMTDMAAARGAGLVAVGVLTGTLDRAALAPHAEAVLDSVAELPAWLDARGAG
ncbi:MAG: HAD family hydrolase [Pseudomonadota bacterium]